MTDSPKPWRGRTPRPHTPAIDVAVAGAEPLAQLTIYRHLTLLTRRTRGAWRQYPVDPAAIGHVFANLARSSGLLPPHTLATGQLEGAPFAVVYVPPQRCTLRTEVAAYDLPLPPLVIGGWNTDYRLYAIAAPTQPTDPGLPLWRAPFPNTYTDGHICWGTSDARPLATPQTIGTVLDLYLTGSAFNAHVVDGKSVQFPTSVLAMWEELVAQQADAYPLDDLLPAERSLGWLVAGGPWGGRQ